MRIDEVASISLRTLTSKTNADGFHTRMVSGSTTREILTVATTASAAHVAVPLT